MSIVLFVSVCSYTGYLMELATAYNSDNNCDIVFDYWGDRYAPQEVLSWMKNAPEVTEAAMLQSYGQMAQIPKEAIPENTLAYLEQSADPLTDTVEVPCVVWFVDDESYRQLLLDNGLEESVFFNAQDPVGVGVASTRFFDYSQEK